MPANQPGEVLVRGYNLMRGYRRSEGHRRDDRRPRLAAYRRCGVLDDEGYLRITDRLKDMFITGGFNVYPAEIEQTLVHYPGVAQAAVIGIADERLGEVAMAFLLPVPGQRIDEAAFLAWCRVQMANYKVPRRVGAGQHAAQCHRQGGQAGVARLGRGACLRTTGARCAPSLR